MTRQAQYHSKSAFSSWLRDQKEIDSRTTMTNITDDDYKIYNYDKNLMMFIEEKTNRSCMRWHEKQAHEFLHCMLEGHHYYRGYHILQFEYESPLDGRMWLNYKEIRVDDLFKFIRFEQQDEWYDTIIFKQ